MKHVLTLFFSLFMCSASAQLNVDMTFTFSNCYNGYNIRPAMISAQKISLKGEVESTNTLATDKKVVSLAEGYYLLKITSTGYKEHVARIIVKNSYATNYEFKLLPLDKDVRLNLEAIQSKTQVSKMYLNGFIVNQDGIPIENAKIKIKSKNAEVLSQSDGYFEVLFQLQNDEEYIDFEVEKASFIKQIYTKVLCWNKGDWSYQIKMQPTDGVEVSTTIESQTAAPHIETSSELLNSLPENEEVSGQLITGSCVPNSINVAYSSTGTNCCPGGGAGFPSCQTVINYSMENYVERVIPNEWLASWNVLPNMIEAYKAAAVAIRSYSTNKVNHHFSGYPSWYDICSSPCCQNIGATNSITSSGVTQTINNVLWYNNDVPLSEYSAENNHLLPQCVTSSYGIFCSDGEFSLNGTCYSDPVSIGKRINGHGRGMSQRGSARWASGKALNSCSNSTTGLANTGYPTKSWTQILSQYYPPYSINNCGNSCPQPPNDLCGGAIILNASSTCNYINGTTCGANPINPTTGMTTCILTPSTASDVWYKFVATNPTALVNVQSAADFDAIVQIFSNVACASSYTQIECQNSTAIGGLESVSLSGLITMNTYWIRITCNTGLSGTDFQICVTSSTISNCPDPYEPNETTSNAYNLFPSGLDINPNSTTANGFITTGADMDYFLLNIISFGTLSVSLGSLPENYEVAIYSNSGQLLNLSIQPGTSDEYFALSYTSASLFTPPFFVKVYPSTSSEFSICDDYTLSVSWSPISQCNTPTTPVLLTGNISCPGNGSYSTNINLNWTNSGSNYDLEIEEYPFGSSNLVYVENCKIGNSAQLTSPSILPGKLYRYNVRATSDCNLCNSPTSPSSYFHLAPTVFPENSVNVCNGVGITLSTPQILVPSPGVVTYQWFKGNVALPGSNSNTYFATQSGNYHVKLTYSGSTICGGITTTTQSLSVVVNVSTTPATPILNSNSPVCEGSTLNLSATNVLGAQYFWTGPNGYSGNNNVITLQTATTSDEGTYSCYVVNNGCQSAIASINTSIDPAPLSSFSYSVNGNTVTFTNTSTNAITYIWDFGDGQTSTQANPVHVYSGSNNFNVCLTSTSPNCNSSSYCQLISLGSVSINSEKTFAKLFNDSNSIHRYWNTIDVVQSLIDSSFICIGVYQNDTSFGHTIQYYKIDKSGEIVWVRELPEFNDASVAKIIKSQNGYLISLYYNESTIMEIDEQGNKLWARSFDYIFNKFNKVNTGGYVSASGNCIGCNGFSIIKIDNVGNTIWEKQFSYSLYPNTTFTINNIVEDPLGNFYLYGYVGDGSASPPFWSWDAVLIKTNSSGDILWTNYIPISASWGFISSLVFDTNNDIIFGSQSRDQLTNIVTGFITKINSAGNVLSSKQISQTGVNVFNSESTNFNCLIYGTSGNPNIINLDSNFDLVNQKEFKLPGIRQVIPTLDSCFILTCGQYLLDPINNEYRYSLFKVSFQDSSCIDTLSSNIIFTNSTINWNQLNNTPNSTTIQNSNFPINPITSYLSDSSICRDCNIVANITPVGNTSLCIGDSLILIADSGMTSYLWSTGQTTQSINIFSSGNYFVTVLDSLTCVGESSIVPITFNTVPHADAGVDQSICLGSSVILGTSATVTNQYSWFPTTGIIDSTSATPLASPISSTTYTVTVTNSFNCTSSSQISIDINPLPVVNAGLDTLINQGDSIVLGGLPLAQGNGPFTFIWNPIDGLSSNIDSNPYAQPNSTITYTIMATDVNGCYNTDSLVIEVDTVGCSFLLSELSDTLPANGGMLILTVTTSSPNCSWSVLSIPSWLQVIPTTLQTGTDIVRITADTCVGAILIDTLIIAGTPFIIVQDCSVGINLVSTQNIFQVFPNPTNDYLNVFGTNLSANNYQINLYDILGQILFTKEVLISDNKVILEIEMNEFKKGVYFLTINSTEQQRNFKIIKQ